MKRAFLLLIVLCCSALIYAQPFTGSNSIIPPYKEHVLKLNQAHYEARPAEKGIGARTTSGGAVFDSSNWAHLIDSTWGAGMADTAKLNLFNYYWGQIDSYYACFVGLPAYNWDSIVNAMRTEISAGVSRGRYAGIIGTLYGLINDGHSHFYDGIVSYGSSIYPGMPVFRGESGLFGACVTTLNDTSALVYSAHAGHPFGLQPGDIILGYNGISWNRLIDIVLRHHLPQAQFIGSTDAATRHKYIQSAGENWFLFDTINIKKCDGTIVNFPTSLMLGHSYNDFCTEQLPLTNIHKVTYSDYVSYNRKTSSGVVAGTRIGYVYLYDCLDFSGDTLYNPVKALVEDSLVHGLIIDIRTNYGGTFLAFFKTFMYLNNGNVSWLGEGDRVNTTNRLLMYSNPTSGYDITDTDPHYWNSPVAILCGPGAISSGDVLSVLFKHDPYLRTFGLNTAGAFGAYNGLTAPYPNYYLSMQVANFYAAANPSFYLSHHPFPIDTTIWFRQDSLCHGADNIVTTAVNWIETTLSVQEQSLTQAMVKVFPNPSDGQLSVVINTPVSEDVSIKLCNVLGVAVKTFSQHTSMGEQVVRLDLSNLHLPCGSYYLTIQGNVLGSVVKKVTIIN